MNLRQAITRTITYSKVSVSCEGENQEYTVYGGTTLKKEMTRILKTYEGNEMPQIKIETITEQRAISLDDFLENSTIINESEEN